MHTVTKLQFASLSGILVYSSITFTICQHFFPLKLEDFWHDFLLYSALNLHFEDIPLDLNIFLYNVTLSLFTLTFGLE